jgi:hypothetical protein
MNDEFENKLKKYVVANFKALYLCMRKMLIKIWHGSAPVHSDFQ